MNSGLNRRIALCLGGLAIAGMGLTVGCSSKQAPAPTAPPQNSVDSKLPQDAPDARPSQGKQPSGNVQAPVKAKPAPTAKPGNTPGDN